MAIRKDTPNILKTKESKSNIFSEAREPSDVAAIAQMVDARLEREREREMAISKGTPYVLSTKKPKTNI